MYQKTRRSLFAYIFTGGKIQKRLSTADKKKTLNLARASFQIIQVSWLIVKLTNSLIKKM